jgi:putative IMPACT (imprinted ancient) family translation regulator
VPGLINAYRTAAAEALSKAKIIEHTINDKFEITFDFESINDVHSIIKSEGATITDQTYETPCVINFELRKSKTNQLLHKLKNHPTLAATANWKLI